MSDKNSDGILDFLDKSIFGPFKIWMIVLFVVIFFARKLIFQSSKKVTASHILVRSEDLCKTLKSEIEKDSEKIYENFANKAKNYSTCPSGKDGGSLGSFGPG